MPFPTYTAEGDIETVIQAALALVLQDELITSVPASDKLRLKTLTALPLQKDPTTSAPYLAYGPAWEIGSTLSDADVVEIGGGLLYETSWKCVCGIPRQRTREAAYSSIANLINRVQRVVVRRHPSLSGILAPGRLTAADGTQYLDGQDPSSMWLGTRRRIYGGDTEFYGEALMFWRYRYYTTAEWLADLTTF